MPSSNTEEKPGELKCIFHFGGKAIMTQVNESLLWII